MRSPSRAILWEIWRVTRVEISWRLSFCIATGLIAVASFAAIAANSGNPESAEARGAALALVAIVMPNCLGWIFLGRLNKGRAGYPFPLLYTRPVSTFSLVALQFGYLTAVQVAIFLIAACILKWVTGYPFPFLPVAGWIAASTLLLNAIYWSSRSVLVQQFLGAVVSGAWLLYAIHRISLFPEGQDWNDSPSVWPTAFQLTLSDWLMFALVGLTSLGVTGYSVARQRRGDAGAAWTPGSGWPAWMVSLFRWPCPTDSATRAQIWFDLKSRGLPVLSLGVMIAIFNTSLFAISNVLDAANPDWTIPAGPMAMMFALMSFPALLVIGGLNAFGIRWRQAGTYFEATQPYSTARLASVKVVVRSACLFAALLVVGGSMWAFLSSFPLLTGDKLFWKMTGMAHIVFLRGVGSAFGALNGFEKLSLLIVTLLAVFVWVATLAVILPLWVRYPRRGNIAASALLLGGLSVSVLALAGRLGLVPEVLVDATFTTMRWIIATALALATIYLLWSGLSERLLSTRFAFGALAAFLAFGAAWLAVLEMAGMRLADMPATGVVSWLSLALSPLLAALLVPWSLGRFRHL
jgi:hypothetical protein